ncbi:NHL repeat-containing protein 3 [Myotis davidii]|uniref:NHL repeat-containing protein 3 n=1 Tax=Myotis davidii TaxID=225400 RepID=L5LAG1_MYODS|nr:NHL repeat-containing protein 3 [Myotis davidii]
MGHEVSIALYTRAHMWSQVRFQSRACTLVAGTSPAGGVQEASDQYFMMLWLHGENGTGPAKFNIPHSVTVDSSGRVWVADRGNKRIQVFDKDTGVWLGAWNNCFTEEGPSSVRFTPDGKYLIVAQLNLSRLLFVAAPPVGSIGYCSVISSIQLADQVLPHLLDISGKTGAIYVAEIGAKQVQKYVPLKS